LSGVSLLIWGLVVINYFCLVRGNWLVTCIAFFAAVVSNCLMCVAHSSCCFSAVQVALGTYVIGAFGHE
jgi:hypothetical protein